MNCIICGNKINRKGSKYCSTDCLYIKNLTKRFIYKISKHTKVKSIMLNCDKGIIKIENDTQNKRDK